MKNSEDTFAGIEGKYADYNSSAILLRSIPFDGTSTWGKGADKGFESFLDAAENMEIYDIETDSEVYKKGIHILPALDGYNTPEDMYKAVLSVTRKQLETSKFHTALGGEHSVSIGLIEAHSEKFRNLSVLQLDAHADLRPSYMGSPYNHACAVHWASKNTNLIQVGIRSMDSSEREHINYDQCYFAEDLYRSSDWMDKSIEQMSDNVYLTLDLDVFDPSIMPSTGTPEPGGLDWNTVIRYLRKVFEQKNVVGFDIVELAPIEGLKAPDFLVAKLYYKLLSYKFHGK